MKITWDYSSLAKHYDKRVDYNAGLVNSVLKKLGLKSNMKVADLGAGTGKLTKILQKKK